MRRSVLAVIAVIVVIVLVVVGAVALTHRSSPATTSNNSPQANNNSSTASAAGTVNIRDMMFTPSQITVQKGATVTWTNNDSVTHNVIDDLNNVGGPHSGDIAPGSTYSFTFNKTGSFQYHCSIHPSMRGTIVVR